MRIISGEFRGRKIICPEGNRIRPTSDMLRSAVFNILNFKVDWEEVIFLDVCCGTGAFGIEALSRGAKFVGFVDSHRESIDATRFNLSKLPVDNSRIEIINNAVEALPVPRKKFNVIYIDPPYQGGLVPKALKSLREKGWIAENAFIMAELAEREKFTAPEGYEITDERRYGNSKLVSLRLVNPVTN